MSDARRADRGVKQAGFWVLWATSMPAVLVELDFICNPESAKFMGSDKGQEQLASALYAAIESYAKSMKPQLSVKNDSSADNVKESKETITKKESRTSRRSNKRRSKKTDDVSETTETAVVPEVTASDAAIPVLNVAGSNSGDRKQSAPAAKSEERSYNYATVHNRTLPLGPLKKLSDQRQIDNGEILIRKETDYLAKVEEPIVEKKTVPEPQPEVKNKNTKNSKDKNKKEKEKKSSSKNVSHSE